VSQIAARLRNTEDLMGKRLKLTTAVLVSAPLVVLPISGLVTGNAFAAPAPALAGSAVTAASLQVSSASATADHVTYSVSFRSVHPLTDGQSTITLGLPARALVATGSCSEWVTDDATQASGCGDPTASGPKVTVKSPVTTSAGDLVTVMLTDVTNPSGPGLKTVLVSTSVDPVPVPLHFVLVPPTAVGRADLQLSSDSALATRVTYSVTFQSPDRFITSQNQAPTITLAAPAGTIFPPFTCGAYQFIDDTQTFSGGCGPSIQLSKGGATVTVVPSSTTGPGDLLTLVVRGVVNAARAGLHSVVLTTSADPAPVHLYYTLVPAQAVSHPFLQMSSYGSSASGVTWSVGFSSPGRLTNFGIDTGNSTVTVLAPAGTVFPTPSGCNNTYILVDPIDGIDHCASVVVSAGGSKLAAQAQSATTPGAVIALVINGVKNPPSAGRLQVWTTSDPVHVSLPTSGPTIPGPAVQLDATSAHASAATYVATFRLSSGFNPANCLNNGSKLVLTASGGTVFPAGGYVLYDLANGTSDGAGACPPKGATYVPGARAPVATGIASGNLTVKPGDYFAVAATGVTNATAAGSYHLGIAASTGTAVAPRYALTPQTTVGSPLLQVPSDAAGATQVHYAVTFRALNGLLPGSSDITLSMPGVAWGPGSGDNDGWAIYDDTTGLVGEGYATYAGKPATPNQPDNPGTAVVTPSTGDGFRADPGDIVTVATDGTVNPASPGPHILALSTSGDPGNADLRLVLHKASAPSVAVLNLSTRQAGAKNASYALSFLSGGGLTSGWSSISMSLPGMVWPPSVGDNAGYTVYDDTTDKAAGSLGTVGGKGTFQPAAGTAIITTGNGAGFYSAPGDLITLVAKPAANPPGAGSHSVAFSTSADPASATATIVLK
jgi:hypothetical protein